MTGSNNLQKEIGPNWFASVMGTGILANAAFTLPIVGQQLKPFATIIWLVAVSLLAILIIVKCWQAVARPHILKRQINDAVMAQFFGAPPMAFLTIAGGFVLFGDQFFSSAVSIKIAWFLWIIGTLTGLAITVWIPFKLFTRFVVREDGAFGGWLMPVVPPMVSAAMGAALIQTLPSQELQQTMLYLCYSFFGMSLVAAFIIITLVWSRLAHSGTSSSARVPTLWIVLGPLGQSITAAGALGTVALSVLPSPLGQTFDNLALVYGVPVWGFAIFWSIIAFLLTVRALKRNMPFALTWWAFTFPVGTCVTGTSQLAMHSSLPFFEWAAVILYIGLVFAWLIAAIGTIRGLRKGALLFNPTNAAPIVSKKGD